MGNVCTWYKNPKCKTNSCAYKVYVDSIFLSFDTNDSTYFLLHKCIILLIGIRLLQLPVFICQTLFTLLVYVLFLVIEK